MKRIGHGWILTQFCGRNLKNGTMVQSKSVYRKHVGRFMRIMQHCETSRWLFTPYASHSETLRLILRKEVI